MSTKFLGRKTKNRVRITHKLFGVQTINFKLDEWLERIFLTDVRVNALVLLLIWIFKRKIGKLVNFESQKTLYFFKGEEE